jgi:NADPH2:quinone reductase
VLVPADVLDPVAGAGQVVVDVAVADTLFIETTVRAGGGGDYFTITPPYVLAAGWPARFVRWVRASTRVGSAAR